MSKQNYEHKLFLVSVGRSADPNPTLCLTVAAARSIELSPALIVVFPSSGASRHLGALLVRSGVEVM